MVRARHPRLHLGRAPCCLFLLLVAGPLCPLACVQGAFEQDRASIAGGRDLEDREYLATVRLSMGARGDTPGGACTATLLAPGLGVTAAHCFGGWPIRADSETEIDGLDQDFATARASSGSWARITYAAIHPLYRRRAAEDPPASLSRYDVAVVRLAPWYDDAHRDPVDYRLVPQDEPDGIVYPVLARSAPGRRCDLEAVGWGLTEDSEAEMVEQALGGDKRALPVCVALGDSNLLTAPRVRPVDWGGGSVCQGDSGGPLVAGDPEGVFRVYGLVRSATSHFGHCQDGLLSIADSFRVETFDNPSVRDFLMPFVGPIALEAEAP